jgi:hypothetical protein
MCWDCWCEIMTIYECRPYLLYNGLEKAAFCFTNGSELYRPVLALVDVCLQRLGIVWTRLRRWSWVTMWFHCRLVLCGRVFLVYILKLLYPRVSQADSDWGIVTGVQNPPFIDTRLQREMGVLWFVNKRSPIGQLNEQWLDNSDPTLIQFLWDFLWSLCFCTITNVKVKVILPSEEWRCWYWKLKTTPITLNRTNCVTFKAE